MSQEQVPIASMGGIEAPVTAAEALEGVRLTDGWVVQQRHQPSADATGGMNSICYRVEHEDGRRGFLKALDYSVAFESDHQALELERLLVAFNHERAIVSRCTDRNLSHVIRAWSAGSVRIRGFGPIINEAHYLIFEEAGGDSRAHLDRMQAFDDAWVLRALHNVSVGLNQLHAVGISHQDMKPSNVLVMPTISKVGDVGRAAVTDIPGPCDANTAWGDLGYAAPEMLYGSPLPNVVHSRLATDAYHLGSLILFFFTRVGTTAALAARVDARLWHGRWDGQYEEALPFLREAFDEVASTLDAAISGPYRHELVGIFRQLCDPDPVLRGDPKAARGSAARYSLQRYTTTLDRLARAAEIALRRALS